MSTKKETKGKFTLNSNGPNYAVAKHLLDVSYEEKTSGGNAFKANAYLKAAKLLDEYPEKVATGKDAMKLKGIGKSIAERIDEFLSYEGYDDDEDDEDSGKPKITKSQVIEENANKRKAKDDKRSAKKKLIDEETENLERLNKPEKNIGKKEIVEVENFIKNKIKKFDTKYKFEICGSYRRGADECDEIDVLVTHSDFKSPIVSKEKIISQHSLLKAFIDYFQKLNFIKEIISSNNNKFSGTCQLNSSIRQINIVFVAENQFVLGLLFLTGSKSFIQSLKETAIKNEFILEEFNLKKLGSHGVTSLPLEVNTEEDIFDWLNLHYKKPKNRNE